MKFSIGRAAALTFLWWLIVLGIGWLVHAEADFQFFPSFQPFGGRDVFTLVMSGALVGLLAKSRLEVVLAVTAAFGFGFLLTFIIHPEAWRIPSILSPLEVGFSLVILLLGTAVGLLVGLLAVGSGATAMRLPAYASVGMAALSYFYSLLGPEEQVRAGLFNPVLTLGDIYIAWMEVVILAILAAIGAVAGIKRVKVVEAVVTACLLAFVYALNLGGSILHIPLGDATDFLVISRNTLWAKWPVILGVGIVLMLGRALGALLNQGRNAPVDPPAQSPG